MKRLLSYFFPQTLVRTSSQYNRRIVVSLADGAPVLVVNGVLQSGAGFVSIWRTVFRHFERSRHSREGGNPAIKNIAVIGVGGGDVLYLLDELFPRASIAAVDIDKKIITIARKHFLLDSLKHITFYAQDAQDFVKGSQKYDYMVIDLFIGNEIPSFLAQRKFLTMLKKRLNPQGAILVNYLKANEVATNRKFEQEARRVFSSVSYFDIAYNRFFLLQ